MNGILGAINGIFLMTRTNSRLAIGLVLGQNYPEFLTYLSINAKNEHFLNGV
jgi:hypothetical protein